jgi:hypothetical protein
MRLLLSLVPALVLSGCGLLGGETKDEDSKPGLLDDHDVDGDGFTYDEDCDDDNAAINPDAPEICDPGDVDEDCNGLADNADPDVVGGITLYHDADADGFGSLTDTIVACEVTTGYSLTTGDCDDADPDINPGGTEICDDADADEDCDGVSDDADPSVDPSSQTEIYIDRDRDGYGDFRVTGLTCGAPDAGWSSNDSDCADGNDAIHPEAVEVCDGLDNDCDGVADDISATDTATWYADDDGDGYGDPADTRRACSQPFGFVADATDCDDLHRGVHPGAVESCDGTDEDCDGTIDDDARDATTWYADVDGDGYGDPAAADRECSSPHGYVADDSDCDDADAAISPAATELCDAADTDEDCDGLADDSDTSAADSGKTIFYADTDGDGYGDADSRVIRCDLPSGYATDRTDCDDTDASVSPAGTEVCDSANTDEDCDGNTDDRDSSVDATTKSTWYRDADGDGYGTTTSTTSACDRPSGYGSTSTDCDDTTSTRSPGNTEVCDGANTDEDCDGVADDADSSVSASGMTSYYLDADGDGFGATSSTISRCDLPSGYGTTGGDCNDGAATVNPGAAEVCLNSLDENCDGSTLCSIAATSDDRELTGETSGGEAGFSLSGAGDFNNDGYDDVLVGAPFASRGGSSYGTAYIVTGGTSGDLGLASAKAYVSGDSSGDLTGYSVAGVGDMDHDGYDDVIVGLPYDSSSGYDAGKVFFVRGQSLSGTLTALTAGGTLTGISANDAAGEVVAAAGDVNHDGTPDFLVGAPEKSSSAGVVYLITSRPSGTSSLSTATAILSGESSNDTAGHSIAPAGDVNGDGTDDFLVGAPGDDDGGTNAGAAYLILGPETGSHSLSTADAKLRGPGGNGGAGESVASAGDVNGDGYDDVVIGTDYGGTGTVYVKYGPFSGSSSLSSAAASITGVIYRIGDAVDGAGDVDGDGHADVLIGCEECGGNTGGAYLMLGPLSGGLTIASADVTISGKASGDRFGYDAAFVGDSDGDGMSDFAVGAPYNDDGVHDGGSVSVFLSSGW